jgi:hypothetical protein
MGSGNDYHNIFPFVLYYKDNRLEAAYMASTERFIL